MAPLPATMQACKIQGPGVARIESNVPLPALEANTVLVRVAAVSINPTDWKHLHAPGLNKPGHTVGCDFAGTVVALGSDMSRPIKLGDRVAGLTHGSRDTDPTDGCFAQYARCTAQSLVRLPEEMPFQAACTLGVAVATQGLGLYQALGLPLPDSDAARSPPHEPLFIYGASSSMGLSAVQYAKLSGCSPIVAACSPRNFDLVKSRGADYAIDYKDPAACAAQVRAVVGDGLRFAYDCIGEGDSGRICAEALTNEHGVARYVSLLYGTSEAFPRKDMALCTTILGYTVLGHRFSLLGTRHFEPSREDVDYATMFYTLSEALLAKGKLTALPFELRPGHLEGVLEGMEALRKGEVSGKKLVYTVEGSSSE